jgi:hypothetical protein
MKIDMHLHVVGRGKDIDQVDDQGFFYPEDNNTLLTRVLSRLVEKYLGAAGADFDRSGTIQLWGDTSAFSLLTRIPILHEILETFPPEGLVHGSDFPIPIEGWVHLPGLTHDVAWEEYKQIKNTENLLDKDVLIKRARGFSDSILENAEKVLRLPQGFS